MLITEEEKGGWQETKRRERRGRETEGGEGKEE